MALSRLYYTRAEVPLDNETSAILLYQSFVYAIFSLLCGVKLGGTTGTNGAPPSGVLWEIDHMCDSVTAGTPGDGVNRWGATFDASKLVRSASGAFAKSWYVIKSPTTLTALGVPFYLTFGMQGAANGNFYVGISKTQPSGGTVNVIPTSVDTVTGGSSFTLLFADLNFSPSVQKIAVVFGANGCFHLEIERTGQSKAHAFMTVWDLTGPESAGDLFPVIMSFCCLTTGRGVPSDTPGGATLHGGGFYTQSSSGNGICTRSRDTITLPITNTGTAIMAPNSQGWFAGLGLNHAGKQEPLECKIWFHNSTAGLSYPKGTLPDWWICNSAKAVGLVDPPTGESELILLGNVWLPNDGVPHVM